MATARDINGKKLRVGDEVKTKKGHYRYFISTITTQNVVNVFDKKNGSFKNESSADFYLVTHKFHWPRHLLYATLALLATGWYLRATKREGGKS